MDFNLKQWRDPQSEEQRQQQQEEDQDAHSHLHSSTALPLFVPQPNSTMSAYSNADHSTKFPRMESYFSLSQWQELQLQALIFRHMIVGADVPPELLHLVKKSLIESPYYLSHSLHQYYPHYQPALLQSGYWGKGAMDPEPGRCRRTDGKKWRCSRDVVAGQKYCERHMHRGRNRSRKPVEIATSAASPYGGAQTLKTNHSIFRQGAAAGGGGGGGGGSPHFTLSGTSHSSDLFHLDRRPCDSIIETKVPFQPQHDEHPANTRTLRHFFDDWPKPDNANAATSLSISMPENPSSDFSLKLGTGNEEGPSTNQRDIKPQMISWGITSWDTNLVANPMGGPLAEALRSSTSTSSPTSVLHRLPPPEISS